MLGKIFKQEMRSTSRMFLPLLGGFLIITLLCKFSFETTYSLAVNSRILELISYIFSMLYFIYIVALFVMTSVFIILHFYKTMVGDQGYLTNTLPVRISTIINGKLLAAVLWQLAAGVMLLLSFFLFSLGHFHLDDIRELFQFINTVYLRLNVYINIPLMVGLVMATAIIGLFSGPLMLYASIAMGHLFRKHRILWAIASYLILYIAIQFINLAVMRIIGNRIPAEYEPISLLSRLMQDCMVYSAVFSAACTAGFYAVTDYVFSKHLNLD